MLQMADLPVLGQTSCREDLLVELTTFTFDLAATRQRPAAGLIHHSDRGSQYAAEAFQRRLSHWGVTSSMSRKANPYDNALAESFVATLKSECFGGLIPSTKAAAKLMVFDYIETFYNRRRRHSAFSFPPSSRVSRCMISWAVFACGVIARRSSSSTAVDNGLLSLCSK